MTRRGFIFNTDGVKLDLSVVNVGIIVTALSQRIFDDRFPGNHLRRYSSFGCTS